MKRRPRVWLVAVMVCCMAGIGGVARAQISVAVTSTVAITVPSGASISNAGAFQVTNSSGAGITISTITISATDGGIFSSMTLTGQVPGTSSVAAPSSPSPPGSSNTFDFSAVGLPTLPNGQTATFQLSAIAISGPVPTPTSDSVHRKRLEVLYAGMMWPMVFGQSKTASILLSAVALGMLLMTGKLRRRHLVLLAMALILAATEVGCGNTNSGITGTSTQVVQTISTSSGGAPSGLPASLGSITVQ